MVPGRVVSRVLIPIVLSSFACGLAGCTPEVANPPLASAASALKVCPPGDTVPGVDVSYWQGAIDWEAVAKAEIEWEGVTASRIVFAIARVAHGTSKDTYFDQNWAAIRAHGMVRGAYLFYEPGKDTLTQAQVVVDAVGMLGEGDLPVTIDVEWNDYGDPNATDLALLADRIEEGTGKRPMIYTAVGYWDPLFDTEFGDLDLWVANWQATCPLIPSSWSGWEFWQTTGGGGSVPGIAGGVDTDLFNGSAAELAVAAGQPAGTGCSIREVLACHRAGRQCADAVCLDPVPDPDPADAGPDAADPVSADDIATDASEAVDAPDTTAPDAIDPAEDLPEPGPEADATAAVDASQDASAPGNDALPTGDAFPWFDAVDAATGIPDDALPAPDPASPGSGGGCTAGAPPSSAASLLALLLAPLVTVRRRRTN